MAAKNGATWRGDGARQTTRLAGRKEDVGTRALLSSPASISQLDPPRKAQDPQAKAITFGVEGETTLLHRWFGQLGKGFFDEGYAHVFFR